MSIEHDSLKFSARVPAHWRMCPTLSLRKLNWAAK